MPAERRLTESPLVDRRARSEETASEVAPVRVTMLRQEAGNMSLSVLTVSLDVRGNESLNGTHGAVTQKLPLSLGAIRPRAIRREVVDIVARGGARAASVERATGLTGRQGRVARSVKLRLTSLKLSDKSRSLVTLREQSVPLVLCFLGETLTCKLSVDLRQTIRDLSETGPKFLDGDNCSLLGKEPRGRLGRSVEVILHRGGVLSGRRLRFLLIRLGCAALIVGRVLRHVA